MSKLSGAFVRLEDDTSVIKERAEFKKMWHGEKLSAMVCFAYMNLLEKHFVGNRHYSLGYSLNKNKMTLQFYPQNLYTSPPKVDSMPQVADFMAECQKSHSALPDHKKRKLEVDEYRYRITGKPTEIIALLKDMVGRGGIVFAAQDASTLPRYNPVKTNESQSDEEDINKFDQAGLDIGIGMSRYGHRFETKEEYCAFSSALDRTLSPYRFEDMEKEARRYTLKLVRQARPRPRPYLPENT